MSTATAILDPDLDEPTDREPTFDHTEIEARITAAREEHLRALGPRVLRDDPAEARRAAHAHAAECERRQRRAELEAGRDGCAFTLIPPRPFPYLAATPARRREPSPKEKPAVTVAAAPIPAPALPEVPGVKPAKVRAVWDAAHRIAARGGVVTSSAIVDEGGGMLGVVFKVQAGLRKLGHWPWPPAHGGPPVAPTASRTDPSPTRRPSRPPSVPRVGRSEPSTGDSTSDAQDRVLGHSRAVPGDASQSDPLVLELLKGTLSAAIAYLGPHLSDRNRFALEMCLEVLR